MNIKDDTAKVNLHDRPTVAWENEFELERIKFQQETLKTSQLIAENNKLRNDAEILVKALERAQNWLWSGHERPVGLLAEIEKALAQYHAAEKEVRVLRWLDAHEDIFYSREIYETIKAALTAPREGDDTRIEEVTPEYMKGIYTGEFTDDGEDEYIEFSEDQIRAIMLKFPDGFKIVRHAAKKGET